MGVGFHSTPYGIIMWVRKGGRLSFIVWDNVEIQGYLVWNRTFIFWCQMWDVTLKWSTVSKGGG